MGEEELLHQLHKVITEIWHAFKPRIVSVNQSQAYWDDTLQAFEEITKRYAGTPAAALANRMSVAAVNALEDRYRELFRKER